MEELHPRAQELNQLLEGANPAVHSALSPLARASYYPKDIPFQAAEAKGAKYNATIGQITDGAGTILSVSAVRDAVELEAQALNRALLYSPIGGQPDLRMAWNDYQTPADSLDGDGTPPCGPPVVTVGLTHAIALVADLFGGPGRDVVIPDPCWGNYVQIFGTRGGARIHRAPSYQRGRWSWAGLRETLEGLGGTEPVVVVLNLPSNPGGYSPTVEERSELVEVLTSAASSRPVVVLCDDAYAGLVYDPDIPAESMFWELLDARDVIPNLIPIRGAGSTKEFLLFGGRVGFLTLPFSETSTEFEVLEDKLLALIRSGVGSPVSLSQMVLLEALRSGSTTEEIAAVRQRLSRRFHCMTEQLENAKGRGDRFRVLPCNSGAFVLLELADGLNAEEIRQKLLREADTGVVAVGQKYIRLAFCSVSRAAIPELVERVCSTLRAQGV